VYTSGGSGMFKVRRGYVPGMSATDTFGTTSKCTPCSAGRIAYDADYTTPCIDCIQKFTTCVAGKVIQDRIVFDNGTSQELVRAAASHVRRGSIAPKK
jgi:hypothetical protein